MRILLVEDDLFFIRIVSTLLSGNTGPVDAVYSGEKGLELLRANKYDLLITDLMMDGMSGTDLIQRALDEDLIDRRRILVMTAEPENSPQRTWLTGPGIYVLQKPFSLAQFREALKLVWPETGIELPIAAMHTESLPDWIKQHFLNSEVPRP